MDSSPALLAQNDKIKESFIYQNSAFYTKFRPKIQPKTKFSPKNSSQISFKPLNLTRNSHIFKNFSKNLQNFATHLLLIGGGHCIISLSKSKFGNFTQKD